MKSNRLMIWFILILPVAANHVYARKAVLSVYQKFLYEVEYPVICVLKINGELERSCLNKREIPCEVRIDHVIRGELANKVMKARLSLWDVFNPALRALEDESGGSAGFLNSLYRIYLTRIKGQPLIFIGNIDGDLLEGYCREYTEERHALLTAAVRSITTHSPAPLFDFLKNPRFGVAAKKLVVGVLNRGRLPFPFLEGWPNDKTIDTGITLADHYGSELKKCVKKNGKSVIGAMLLCLYARLCNNSDTQYLLHSLWGNRRSGDGFCILAASVVLVSRDIRDKIFGNLASLARCYSDYDHVVARNLLGLFLKWEPSDFGNVSVVLLCNMLDDDESVSVSGIRDEQGHLLSHGIVAQCAQEILGRIYGFRFPLGSMNGLGLVTGKVDSVPKVDVKVYWQFKRIDAERFALEIYAGNYSGHRIALGKFWYLDVLLEHFSDHEQVPGPNVVRKISPGEIVSCGRVVFEVAEVPELLGVLSNGKDQRAGRCDVFVFFRNPYPRCHAHRNCSLWFGRFRAIRLPANLKTRQIRED